MKIWIRVLIILNILSFVGTPVKFINLRIKQNFKPLKKPSFQRFLEISRILLV